MGILFAFISFLLLYIFSPFMLLYSIIITPSLKSISKHFFRIAISIDQLGNVIASDLFNHILIKSDGFKFGDEDETISSVIGRNYQTNTLKPFGRSLRYYLDLIEKNHCINAIEKNTNN